MTVSAEIPFEAIYLALESVRGTAITSPTHYMPMKGMLTPEKSLYTPEESRGTLERGYRSRRTRVRSTWEASGGLDPRYLPFFLNLVCKANSSPTTPANGILTRLWTFVPTITSDDLKSATFWWGDPNVQIFRAAYGMAEELTIESDAGSEDGVTMAIKGFAKKAAPVSAPSAPAQTIGSLLVPGAMQLWVDYGATAIGTTAVTGRFLATSWTIPTGVKPKWYAAGTSFDGSFTRTGRETRQAKMDVTVELNSDSIAANAEYDLYDDDTLVKVRCRLNGDLIESVTPDYYEYCQMDIYGRFGDFSWEEVEGVNRAMKLSIDSLYDATLGASFSLAVQNQSATL